MTAPIIVWFRRDLRLADNAALFDAASQAPILPVYIHAPTEEGEFAPGGATKVWLHHALVSLTEDLAKRGLRLIIRRGTSSLEELERLVDEVGASGVFWNRLYDPHTIPRDTAIKEALKARGVTAKSFSGCLLHEPRTVANKSGKPFLVFTPFWKHLTAFSEPDAPLPIPVMEPSAHTPSSLPVNELQLLPEIPWDGTIRATWEMSEAGAHSALDTFLAEALIRYEDDRNRPDITGSSRLSAYLHFGHVSPSQVWNAVREAQRAIGSGARKGAECYLREIGWREFGHHLLFHFPHLATSPLRPEFASFPWADDERHLRAWQKGRTGYSIVDAGMRELWATGWMHNRVRMIVASFLTKHLRLPWQRGAQWFWDTLVDADLANNTLGWQWTAGCGADAQPYFRIFNPITQGETFDPEGAYVRQWVPEIAKLPNKFLMKPWEAPAGVLMAAGVKLGADYPYPIVDHATARQEALAAFDKIKKSPSAG